MEAAKNWTTWWSKAQRGVGLVYREKRLRQEVQIQIPKVRAIRFRFASYYDKDDILLQDAFCSIGSKRVSLTFQGKTEINIKPQTMIYSDVIEIEADSQLTLQYCLRSKQAIASGIQLYPYDEVHGEDDVVFVFQGIDVISDDIKGCVCILGDSIVEMGTWTALIKQWLKQRGYVFLNHGISGNRLCRELSCVQIDEQHRYMFEDTCIKEEEQVGIHANISLANQCFGKAAIKRFPQEVLADNVNLTHLIFSIGVNDLYQPGTFCASIEELIDVKTYQHNLLSLYEQARKRGIQCIACTLTPFLKSSGSSLEKEVLRTQINTWIQAEKIWLDVIDFDPTIKDEDGSIRMDYHIGDFLHPNELGGKAMAEAAKRRLERWL